MKQTQTSKEVLRGKYTALRNEEMNKGSNDNEAAFILWQKLLDSNRELYEALLEASSIFDNYPETHELVGTIEVVTNAINNNAKNI